MREEEIAEAFLRVRSFECDHDLDWLGEGVKPDFFCRAGSLDLWVEVKTLRSSEAENDHVHRIWDYLRQKAQADHTIGQGWSMVFVSQDATQRDAKVCLALARHAFSLPEMKAARDTYVIIPDDPVGGRVHFTAMSREGLSLFVCSFCESGVYGVPFAFQADPWDQKIQVWKEGVAGPPLPHHKVIRDGAYRLALRIFPDTCHFRVASSMRAEGAMQSTTIDRLRSAIKTAAKQLKRGMTARPGPGVVFLYHSGVLAAEEREIFSALFGDLQYSFLPGQFESGALHYGPNGIVNAGQHRSVSAMTYFPDNAQPMTVHNPWAHTPLPTGVFGGREWVPESDTLKLIEH